MQDALKERLDHATFTEGSPPSDHGALRERGARVMVRGDGISLWDSDGHKVIDGMSGLWCVNIGYGRTSMSDAVYRQMQQLPFCEADLPLLDELVKGSR